MRRLCGPPGRPPGIVGCWPLPYRQPFCFHANGIPFAVQHPFHPTSRPIGSPPTLSTTFPPSRTSPSTPPSPPADLIQELNNRCLQLETSLSQIVETLGDCAGKVVGHNAVFPVFPTDAINLRNTLPSTMSRCRSRCRSTPTSI